MATKYEDEKNKTAAKASAAQSAAAQAAKQATTANKAPSFWSDVKGLGGKVVEMVEAAKRSQINQEGAADLKRNAWALGGPGNIPGAVSDGVKPGGINPVSPATINKPGSRDTVAPRGITADPTNQQSPSSIAAQRAAQPGQASQSPTGNRYLDMAQYGNNPLMNPSLIDAMTKPASEKDLQRFREMGGVQTVRGAMDPKERTSVTWWNPNTLREHATIQEGLMGVDYPVAAQRYGIDAPIQGGIAREGIKAAADVARERIGLEKPVPVKMVDPMGNESEVLAYPDRTKIGSGKAGGPDPAKVVEDMAAANSREEAQAILEGQPPAVQEQVRKLWGIVRSLSERQ